MTTKIKKASTAVKLWANSVAVNDNDMIYLRKKNGIMYVMKIEPHVSGKWEKLDPLDVPVITDPHGAKLENVTLADLRSELTVEVKEDFSPLYGITTGWYQDSSANLYRYDGAGVWNTDMLQWTKLLKLANSGSLEFIG